MSGFGPVIVGDVFDEEVTASYGPTSLSDLYDAIAASGFGPVYLTEELEVRVPGIKGKQIRTGTFSVATANLIDGVFSANVAGRAKIADGYFDEATFESKVAALAITSGKLKLSGQTYDFSTAAALRAATPVAATDVANKTYVDSLVNGLNWQPAVNVMFYVGTRTIAQINALTPAAGWSVVAGDIGTPTAGTSDALAAGDVAEFDGTSWIRIVQQVGGFPPSGTRAVIAWPSSTTIYGPLVDNTDEGKIAQWDGASLTPTLTTPLDGWAVLCRGSTANPPTAYNENKGFSFTGTVPTGSWNQVAGPMPYATVGELSTVNAGDAASAGASANVSRGDHQHAVATAAPSSNLTGDTTNSEGASTSLARADHGHAIGTGTPADVGTANAAGSSANLVRADHVHRSPKPYVGDKSLPAVATTGNYQATGITIGATPALDGHVTVYVNGIRVSVGNGNRDDVGPGTNNVECYFSNDAGATARAIADIAILDALYWNGDHAGYDLAVTDVVDIVYETF